MLPSAKISRQTVVDYRAAALSSGRYDLLALEYTYPLSIYIRGEPRVVHRPEDVMRFYAGFHTAMRGEGLYDLNGKVTAEDLPRTGRFRVWTDWSSVGSSGLARTVASTVCYCSVVGGLVSTDMIDFTLLALPLLFA